MVGNNRIIKRTLAERRMQPPATTLSFLLVAEGLASYLSWNGRIH